MKGGQVVREARRRAGLTQVQLAGILGSTQSAVARVERGGVAPSFDRVVNAVRACGFDLAVAIVPTDDDDAWTLARENTRLTPRERFARAAATGDLIVRARAARARNR